MPPERGSIFTYTGARKVAKNLDTLSKIQIERMNKAISDEADKIVKKAKTLTPVFTPTDERPYYYKQGRKIGRGGTKPGRLKESGRRTGPKRRHGGDFEWQIIFGGKKVRGIFVDYAVYVHERSDLAHKVGTHNFLTKALQELAPGFIKRVGKKARLPRRVF